MKKLLPILLLAVLASCSSKQTSWPEVETTHKPFTRWWWLGSAVDKENLTYNLEAYANAGIGGVEITPIYGMIGNEANDIEYLSPEWMEMYKHTVAESNRLGMLVDLNNGTGWPFGGPQVTVEDQATKVIFEKYVQKGGGRFLGKIAVSDPKQADVSTLIRVMAYGPGGEKLDITDKMAPDGSLDWVAPASDWTASPGDWTVYAVFTGKTMQKVKRAAPGGEGYVMDHLSHKAFDHYIARFDEAFTPDVPAPRSFFNDSYEVHSADWTPDLLDEFAKRRGYKLEEYLPEFEANDTTELSTRLVADYRLTINELLLDNFIYPWRDWVHGKGALVRNQSHGSPGNLIDIYASVDIPESEIFGRTEFDIPGLRKDSITRYNDANPMVLKFASSAAHIAGKNLVSNETFTWLAEHFRASLSQCKPELDLVLASGINHVFFHGTPYSPKDAEWPGWLFYASVNMSPTNSIWRDASGLFTYITRCQSFLQMGQADNDVLLYFPMDDVRNMHEKNRFQPLGIHGLEARLPEFNRVVSDIMAEGHDPDYISDAFIATTKVEKGEFITSGGARYRALVIPATTAMPPATLEKIIALAEAGGQVIFEGRYPSQVMGLSQLETRQAQMDVLVRKLPAVSFDKTTVSPVGQGRIITGAGYKELLAQTGIESESFRNEFGGQYLRRKFDGGHIYFLTMLKDNPIDGWVTLGKAAKSVIIFDPMTGARGLARTRTADGQTQVYLQLEPGQSVILKAFTNKRARLDSWIYYQKDPQVKPLAIADNWELSFVDSEPAIEDTFYIGALGSWTALGREDATVNVGTALYKTTFALPDDLKESQWLLSLGDVRESARVRINGHDVTTLWAVPFEAHVGQYLKEGQNTLEVEVTNLPANRIADYCRRNVPWRKFKDANIVSIAYGPVAFENWDVMPSGLLGPVTLVPMERQTFSK